MSSSITLRGAQLLPMWRRRIPKYPIYWKGDPQRRLFLPQFWMRLMKPENDVPKSEVHFETHPQMSHFDIKSYLEKIYKVPVLHVDTEVIRGEDLKNDKNIVTHRAPDKQMAYVVLDEGHEFEFPDIFGEKGFSLEKEHKEMKQTKRDGQERYQKNYQHFSIPEWLR